MSDKPATPEIEVFTQTHCASCRQVETYLRDAGVAFALRDIGKDAAALEEVTSRGYMSTPVTRIGDQWVSGFKRSAFDRLLGLDR